MRFANIAAITIALLTLSGCTASQFSSFATEALTTVVGAAIDNANGTPAACCAPPKHRK